VRQNTKSRETFGHPAFCCLKVARGTIGRMWKKLLRRAKKRVVKKTPARAHFKNHQEVARLLIHERLAHFAPLCGVVYKRVAVRNQRRRWGSCSSLGNLNFNYRLIFLPAHLCDYVIVHELCHLKEMNHGPNFWAEVEKVMPDYKASEAELRIIEKKFGAMVAQNAFTETSYFGQLVRRVAVVS
jgi:predicted metal-dependent hydrolase